MFLINFLLTTLYMDTTHSTNFPSHTFYEYFKYYKHLETCEIVGNFGTLSTVVF